VVDGRLNANQSPKRKDTVTRRKRRFKRPRGNNSVAAQRMRNRKNSERCFSHPEVIRRKIFHPGRDQQVLPLPPPLVITKSTIVTNGRGDTLVHYFRNAISKRLCVDLFNSIEELRRTLPPDHDKTRRIDELYHLGHWRFYSHEIRAAKKTMAAPAQTWITTNKALFDRLSSVFARFYPGLAEDYLALPEDILLFNLWSVVAINLNAPSAAHIDRNDWKEGFCLVLPVGDWLEGGEVHFKHLNLTVQVKQKDFLLFQSHVLVHENIPWPVQQTRHSIVLVTHHTMFNSNYVLENLARQKQKEEENEA